MAPQLRQQQQYQGRDTAARLQDARAIERAITDLGQTFQKMAGLVAAQSEVRRFHVCVHACMHLLSHGLLL